MPGTRFLQRCILAATAIVLSAATCFATQRPEDVLPDAMYATGKGCAVIKKTLPEDVEKFTFHALYNTDLYGPDLACGFTEAAKSGIATTVKANCQFGGTAKPSTIVIKPAKTKGMGVQVSMTNAHGKETDLGVFTYCGKILAQ